MKRVIALTIGAAVLGAMFFSAPQIGRAQNTAARQTSVSGGTRIAVLNMFVITKGYKRIVDFKSQMKAMTKPVEEQVKKYQEGLKKWKSYLDQTTDLKEKEKARKAIKDFKRAIEDISADVNKKIMERAKGHVTTVYREIEDAVNRYAKANGIQLVFHYYEPLDEKLAVTNIQRKLAASGELRATAPLYIGPGLDISEPVLQMLNNHYNNAASQTGK